MYIDVGYIEERVKKSDLIEITRDKHDPANYNINRINAAIIDAEAELNNAIQQAGYIIPIITPNDFIKRIVFDIALYYIYATKYDDQEMKDVYVRYNKAFSKINKIATGELIVEGLAKISKPAFACMVTNKNITDTVFTKCSLR